MIPTDDLTQRWEAYRQKNPGVRIRNVADALGVSEAELTATGCGKHVTRLDADWSELLERLESLDEVMALTRNDACVHEKTGVYEDVHISEDRRIGLVLDEPIDLRLFFDHWHLGFAVETPWTGARDGLRRSLQFFDRDGTAVHKVFLTRKSNVDAYKELVRSYRHVNQEPHQPVEPLPPAEPENHDVAVDAVGFLQAWHALEDTHDFFSLLKTYAVSRTQALRLAEGDLSERVQVDSARLALQRAAATETPIMVFVGSRGCIQIHSGPVRMLRETGLWYNVLDPGFNMHLNESMIDQAWVVRKPTKDGVVTSLELFDARGDIIIQFFGKRKPGIPELEAWREIVRTLPRSAEGEAV